MREFTEAEDKLMATKIDIEFNPVKFDIEVVELLEKYLHRDEKEYVFDLQLAMPGTVQVDYQGGTFNRNPLNDLNELLDEGFFEEMEKKVLPAEQMKDKIKNLKKANNG